MELNDKRFIISFIIVTFIASTGLILLSLIGILYLLRYSRGRDEKDDRLVSNWLCSFLGNIRRRKVILFGMERQ